MKLSYEQPTSAHRALRGARVRHGDTTEVEIVVGVIPAASGPHLAFCSAWAKAGRILRRGAWWERCQPIHGNVVFANADTIAEKIGKHRGMVYMKGKAVTNGHVEFRMDPESIRVFPVDNEGCLRSIFGQSLARDILERSLA